MSGVVVFALGSVAAQRAPKPRRQPTFPFHVGVEGAMVHVRIWASGTLEGPH
jgi:hypothetical protein